MGATQQALLMSAGRLKLTAHSATDLTSVSITFNSNGSLVGTGGIANFNPSDEWWTNPPAAGSLYEVAYTQLVSGNGPDTGASLGSYQALSSNRAWSRGNSVSDGGVWRFRVRLIADTSVFVEADMTMTIVGL